MRATAGAKVSSGIPTQVTADSARESSRRYDGEQGCDDNDYQ
jgi:hypothetical protein